jgi:hypothetical protein
MHRKLGFRELESGKIRAEKRIDGALSKCAMVKVSSGLQYTKDRCVLSAMYR